MLYEMASGVRPFSGESSISTLGAIIHKDPPPLGPEVPRELQKVIFRCLRKEPDRRFQSMRDVQLELQELKEDSDSGKRIENGVPSARPRLDRGFTVGIVAVVVIAAGAPFCLSTWRQSTLPPAVDDLVPQVVPLTSFRGLEQYPSFSPDGNEVAFAWDGEQEDNTDIYVQQIGTGPPQRITTDSAVDTAPAWSPDGRQLAFLRAVGLLRRRVMLVPSRGGPEIALAEIELKGNSIVPTIAWHPDGLHLAITDEDALILLSVESRQKRRLLTPPASGAAYVEPAFSSDGRNLAFVEARNITTVLYVQALDDTLAPVGEPRRLDVESPQFPVWTPDGRNVIVGRWAIPRFLRRIAASGNGPAVPLPFGQGAYGLALSRDGRRLTFGQLTTDTNIWRIDLGRSGAAPAQIVPRINSTTGEQHVQYSPDGRRIAFSSARSGATNVWISNVDGTNLVQVTNLGGAPSGTPRWSPDGKQIAFDSRRNDQSDVFIVSADGGTPRQLTTDPSEDFIPSWSRDGNWVYFESNRSGGGAHGQVWKMPAAEGAAPGRAVQVTKNGGTGAFESTDGTLLYYWKWDGSIWQVPVGGGDETRVIDSVFGWFASFAVAKDGICYVSRTAEKLSFAKELGAVATVNASDGKSAEEITELTSGGAHVSVDALGDADTTIPAVLCLRPRGRHLRLGTSSQKQGGSIPLPVDMFVFRELQFIGSFGMQAARYPDMLRMVESGKLHPGKLVRGTVSIEQASSVLTDMTSYNTVGMHVITGW